MIKKMWNNFTNWLWWSIFGNAFDVGFDDAESSFADIIMAIDRNVKKDKEFRAEIINYVREYMIHE